MTIRSTLNQKMEVVHKFGAYIPCLASVHGRHLKGGGEGKDERTKCDKIGRGRITVTSPSCAHFDFPPFLRPATQAIVWQFGPNNEKLTDL